MTSVARRNLLVTVVLLGAAGLVWYRATVRQEPADWARDWPAYGGDHAQTRYSALTQINRSNVAELEIVWAFDTGETGGLQTSPLVVDGVAYVLSPTHKVFALDAASGSVRWRFDSGIVGRGPNRGLMAWSDGATSRIYTAQSHFLYALDALSGSPIETFGSQGRIDLRNDLGRDPERQSVALTTPGVVYEDLVIVGGRVGENHTASPGHIRAYDARTGALRWTFHTIPQPGELGYETWPEDAWTYTGGANNWAGLSLDAERGIVYVPTGSATSDFYGADRLGDNLFANTLLALDARTGERIWHFQIVRHDIWDRDLPSPPTLVSIERGDRTIEAVAQATKHGLLFVFDRLSGEPLFPIENREYPPSRVAGERSAVTQPVPTRPEPFARQVLTEDLLTDRTPEARARVLEQFREMRSGGQFVPLAVGRPTVVFPGFDGGAEWGGSAFDRETGLLYLNANEMAWTGALAQTSEAGYGRQLYEIQCATCHGDDLRGSPPQIPALVDRIGELPAAELAVIVREGVGRMAGFPALSDADLEALTRYLREGDGEIGGEQPSVRAGMRYRFTGFKRFLDPDGYPAVRPPWGTLNAIDLSTGEYAWRIPLGEYPELAEQGVEDTGSENYGGPIVTAGGLVFIGATNFDRKFRAFDKATGELLWETQLPYSANGTPATYEIDGRQYVLVPAGGGKSRPNAEPTSGGTYVAFALPQR